MTGTTVRELFVDEDWYARELADLRGATLSGTDLDQACMHGTRIDLAGAIVYAEAAGAFVDP